MNTIIQIWNLFFNCVFSDNGFLVAFGFAALGILTAITAALLFLIPIMLLRSFFTWISLYIPDSVSKHYKNRTWVPCKGIKGSSLYCPVAFDENGYLLVNTTTPDGYYVNEYGVLTIDGVEVVHAGECKIFPWKLDTTDIYGNVIDKNNCDLSTIDLRNTTHSMMSDGGAYIPFGRLAYMHTESQQPDGTFAPGLGFNSCAQIYKEFYPNSYGADVGPEPATFR